MTKEKIGLVLFWIAIIWIFIWLVINWTMAGPAVKYLTMEELNQTMWTMNGPWLMLSGMAIPLGGILAGIGILLYSGAKASMVWRVGIGLFIGFVIALIFPLLGHFPPLFGIGGTMIVLSFIGILWLWAKERMAMKGSSTAADFKLVGFVFMLIAAWFICGIASQPYYKVYEALPQTSPINVMILLVLGWVFLFLGYYKSRKQ